MIARRIGGGTIEVGMGVWIAFSATGCHHRGWSLRRGGMCEAKETLEGGLRIDR